MKRLLPYLSVPATFGVILAFRGFGILFFLLLSIFIIFCYYHRNLFHHYLMLFPLIFIVFYFLSQNTLHQHVSVYDENIQKIDGVIHSIPLIDGDSFSMRFKSNENEIIQVQSYISTEKEKSSLERLSPGDYCRLTGKLERPHSPTNFGQFDYRRYLEGQNIFWVIKPNLTQLQCEERDGISYFLQRWRQKQMVKLEKEVSPQLNGIMTALIFGERMMMEEELLEAYKKLGVIHLLAVSGLHVGMIVASFFYLLIRIGITRERAMEILLFFLPLYIVIAGASPSVIRAASMSMIVLICLKWRIHLSPLDGITFVYLVYLMIDPVQLFHLGFQLSFLLSFSLIITVPVIQKRYEHFLTQLVAMTTLTQFLSIPLLLYNVYEIPWISIPINIVYIPFVTIFVLPFSLLAYILLFLFPAAVNIPLYMLETVIPIAHTTLTQIANLKWSTLIVGKPSPYFIILFYSVIVGGCIAFEIGNKGWWRKPVLIFTLLMLIQIAIPFMDPRAKVTMIDVGQGDSFLIELPYRKDVYLIDAGGTISFFDDEWRERKKTFDVGMNTIVPILKERGIRRIDRLILTHGHIDHIGGAKGIAQSIRITEILYGEGPINGKEEREILESLIKGDSDISFVKEGYDWNVGSAYFKVLSPMGHEPIEDLNARSIVLYGKIEGISFLFTGDLEEEGERDLLLKYPQLNVDILKAGHHGSRTSSTEPFIKQISPKAVFISAGRNSRFGHPHDEVIERFFEHDVEIWRSDEGSVQLEIKKGRVIVNKANEDG